MKKIYTLTFILYSILSFGQHPDLTSQRWFVKNITINNVTTEIPNDPITFPFIDLYFYSGGSNLITSSNTVIVNDCQIGFTGHIDFNSTNRFNYNDFTPFSTTTNCGTPIIDFTNQYVTFYNDEITEEFTYIITNLIDRKTLIVTSNTGNQIEYTSKVFGDIPTYIADINWVLDELIIDNISHEIPNNSEVNSISTFFNYYESQNFSTAVCAGLFGITNFIENENQFYLYELITTLNDCGGSENQNFQNLYLGFFMDNLSNPFTYDMTFSGEYLLITDILGNTAQYRNATASVEDYSNSLFTIYPNPVKDIVTIEEKTNVSIENISVYNYLGKKIFTTKNKKINMQSLKTGMYLVKIEFENGKIELKKVVKS